MIHKFPDEIIHDILLRLPPKSLIRCTSVCKPWNSLIKKPSFIRTHLRRAIDFNNQFGTHLLFLHCVPGAGYRIGIDQPREEHYTLHYDNHTFDEYCKLEFPLVPKWNKFLRVVGICNGLAFLADDRMLLGYTFIICNPSIRKSVTLPKPHLIFDTIGPYSACVGFGFDVATNDYKVVRLVTAQCEIPTYFEVYSLARGSWSDPRSFDPACDVVEPPVPQAFVNGAIHWKAARCLKTGGCQIVVVLAFDVANELFREIMVPECFRQVGLDWRVSVSGDGKSIALFKESRNYYPKESSLEIWVMKEYCMEESWTKLITLWSSGPRRSLPYKPLCFRKSGEVLSVWRNDQNYRDEIVSLDLVSKQLKSHGIREYDYYFADSYDESLVFLDNIDAVSYRGTEQV